MSHINKKVAGVLVITLKHATAKHAQTIWLLERSHASIEQALRLKQASEDHCDTNTSLLRSSIIIILITQVMAVSQAEFFLAVFPMISWI